MDLFQRLRDLAYRTKERFDEHDTRILTLEQNSVPITVGPTPPSNPNANSLWVDTN